MLVAVPTHTLIALATEVILAPQGRVPALVILPEPSAVVGRPVPVLIRAAPARKPLLFAQRERVAAPYRKAATWPMARFAADGLRAQARFPRGHVALPEHKQLQLAVTDLVVARLLKAVS